MEKIYDALISYDINTKNDSAVHNAVKECMIAKGYADRLTDLSTTNKTIFYLPNTTLWKQNITVIIARADLKYCIDEYNKKHATKHEIEKCVALEFTSIWSAFYTTQYTTQCNAPRKNRTI